MGKAPEEWFRQAFYDIDTAEYLFNGGRYIYKGNPEKQGDTGVVETTVVEAITFLGQRLEKNGLKIEKIILFGSYAKGTATEESDIDIVIVSKNFENKDIFERADITKEAEIMMIKKFMIPLILLL